MVHLAYQVGGALSTCRLPFRSMILDRYPEQDSTMFPFPGDQLPMFVYPKVRSRSVQHDSQENRTLYMICFSFSGDVCVTSTALSSDEQSVILHQLSLGNHKRHQRLRLPAQSHNSPACPWHDRECCWSSDRVEIPQNHPSLASCSPTWMEGEHTPPVSPSTSRYDLPRQGKNMVSGPAFQPFVTKLSTTSFRVATSATTKQRFHHRSCKSYCFVSHVRQQCTSDA